MARLPRDMRAEEADSLDAMCVTMVGTGVALPVPTLSPIKPSAVTPVLKFSGIRSTAPNRSTESALSAIGRALPLATDHQTATLVGQSRPTSATSLVRPGSNPDARRRRRARQGR